MSSKARGRPKQRVIVAGAGIGGLSCAYELMRRGHDVTVLEASGRTGGHVMTLREPLADGLYADMGAEHFTKPGYDLFWGYTREFNLPVLAFPRRQNIVQTIKGVRYTATQLRSRTVLRRLGFNQREVDFLAEHAWHELPLLYFGPHLSAFTDEYQPFGVGLDDLDRISVNAWLKRAGASATAVRIAGAESVTRGVGAVAGESALYRLWQTAIVQLRGVPNFPTDLYRLEGGNQRMTDAFAARLGARVRLNCFVKSIAHGTAGVTVRGLEAGRPFKLDADYLVNALPLTALRRLSVKPAWPRAKAHVIRNVRYTQQSRIVFQTRTPFWKQRGTSGNMRLEGDVYWTCPIAEEIDSTRGLLMASGSDEVTVEQAVDALRRGMPGSAGQIEQALVKVWVADRLAPSCERQPFPLGQLHRFWPEIMRPHGRIHFAGAYADNLIWGMEAATRSANRVARDIDALEENA